MHNPSQNPLKLDKLADLREQLKAQRSKRVAAQKRLKEASAEAAEGTPADSSVFHMFVVPKINGYTTRDESNRISEAHDDKDQSCRPCKEDLIAARKARKNRLAALKKTSFEIVAYRETRRFKKDMI